MTSSRWAEFIRLTARGKPASFVLEGIKLFKSQNKSRNFAALDLGSGAGNNARVLGRAGFMVTAVDSAPESISEIRRYRSENIVAIKKNMSSFKIAPGSYDIIVAWNSLPFIQKDNLKKIFRDVKLGLKPGGLMIVSLFGPNDGWAKINKKITFLSVSEIKRMMGRSVELVKLQENEGDGMTASGKKKYWHTIRFIARRSHPT